MDSQSQNLCQNCKGKVDSQNQPQSETMSKNVSPNLTTDAVVLRKHNTDIEILLIKRANEPFKNYLALPGGFVDYNEDPAEGCLRELKEECNLVGEKIEFLTVRSNPNRDPRKHIVSIVYLVNVDEKSEPKAGDDAKDAKFYNFNEIMNNKEMIAFDHYDILKELCQKKFSYKFI